MHVSDPVDATAGTDTYGGAGTADSIGASIARGWTFLRTATRGPSAWTLSLSLDVRMPSGGVFRAAQAREHVRTALGRELGYDVGTDGFGAMLALQLTPAAEHDLVCALARRVGDCRSVNRFRFFPDDFRFAADTDCTAVAAAALHAHGLLPEPHLDAVAEELAGAAAHRGPADGIDVREGVVMVYWEDDVEPGAAPRGRKHDPVACANTAYVFHLAGHRHPACDATMNYLRDHAASERLLHGTRYYPAPAAFLYAASRGCARFDAYEAALCEPLRDAYRRYQESTTSDACELPALELALMSIAADNLGIEDGRHRRRAALAGLQQPDGSWPAHGYFRTGRTPLYFGSSWLTTLFAVTALSSQNRGRGHSHAPH
ncbi:hypothetical protein ACTVZO_37390 [Streptomyces sp. IBSNAI002]|uniref:hypothetical protein n=1 Tax=Streptomyces sp. IBSNAI002 TaxID=3457500 RepID=UPI003FD66390